MLHLLLPLALALAGEWSYVTPEEGRFAHPPLRAVELGYELPADVPVKVKFRGRLQRCAQLRYGSPGSLRVLVVLDEAEDGTDLYVDAERNRVLEPHDLVLPTGEATWQVPLDIAVSTEGTTELLRRSMLFRLGSTGRVLSYAAAGYLEGRTTLAGRDALVRRADGNANGVFSDDQDRLWIDLNGDGRFSAFTEQHLFRPVLELGGARHAVHSDPWGRALRFEELTGTGTLRFALEPSGGADREVLDLAVSLVSRGGSAFIARGEDAAVEVPAGEYRIAMVSLTLKGSGLGRGWDFVFSDSGGRPPWTWYRVEDGAELQVDPIGTLDFEQAPASPERAAPGERLAVNPRLYTAGGLLINQSGAPAARIALETADGDVVARGSSGFA